MSSAWLAGSQATPCVSWRVHFADHFYTNWLLPVLPGADAKYRAIGDAVCIPRVNHLNIIHPGVRVLEVNDSPGKGPRHHNVETPPDSKGGSIMCNLDRPATPFGVMWQVLAPRGWKLVSCSQ
jgi:hypothetical protein